MWLTLAQYESQVVQVVDPTAQMQAMTDAAAIGGTQVFMLLLTAFVLAVFVGAEIIGKIPPTLHTPLMSGSNAISGITVIGAIFATGTGQADFAAFLGFIAIILAMVNVVGGFLVTHRMLEKFKR